MTWITCSSESVFWLRSAAVRAANSASVDPSVARRILVGKMLISPPSLGTVCAKRMMSVTRRSRSPASLGCGGRRQRSSDGGLGGFSDRPPVIPYLGDQDANDLGHRDGQERPGDTQQLPSNQQGDQDHQPVELHGLAVDQRLEQIALHLLID